MIRLLRRLIDGPDGSFLAQLARLKQATADLPKPNPIKGMETRDRDKTHEYTLNDVTALEIRKEQEQGRQPKVRRMPLREVQ